MPATAHKHRGSENQEQIPNDGSCYGRLDHFDKAGMQRKNTDDEFGGVPEGHIQKSSPRRRSARRETIPLLSPMNFASGMIATAERKKTGTAPALKKAASAAAGTKIRSQRNILIIAETV